MALSHSLFGVGMPTFGVSFVEKGFLPLLPDGRHAVGSSKILYSPHCNCTARAMRGFGSVVKI